MSDDLIELASNGVLTLTLNRPARKNALTAEVGWALVEAVDRAAKDDAIRVIVITGGTPGPNAAFCSGADLASPSREESPQKSSSELLDDTDWIGQFLLNWHRLSTPWGASKLVARP